MMGRSSKLFTLLFVFVLLGAGHSDTGFRRYAGEFMSIDVSPRAQALGGAYGALVQDVTAGFYNPAALALVEHTQVAFMHAWQFSSLVNYDYLAFARPISASKTLGIALIRLGVDNIKDTRAALVGNPSGDFRLDLSRVKNFNAADYVFFFSLGQRFGSRWLLGLNAKLVRRNLAEHAAHGLGLDAAAVYQLNNKLRLSLLLRNITSTLIAWDTGERELVSPTIHVGSAYRLAVPGLPATFTPVAELLLRTESLPRLEEEGKVLSAGGMVNGLVGGELAVYQALFVRAGVDELQRTSFGVGIKIPHLNVDYSFTSFDRELGNSHRIGLVVDFGSR